MIQNNLTKLFTAFVLATGFSSCELSVNRVEEESEEQEILVEKDNISGFVQRGPYLKKVPVVFSEIDSMMSLTGRSFEFETENDLGAYRASGVKLVYPYVEVSAEGDYFNEVLNKGSDTKLELSALVDITAIQSNTINLNLLSYLTTDRIKYLVAEEGLDFSVAQQQAQREVLDIFEIEKADIMPFEMLDITNSGADHTILQAVSLILQGHESTDALKALILGINNDIKQDGILDNESLGARLFVQAQMVDYTETRRNLKNRYALFGKNITLGDFETYISNFVEQTDFEQVENIYYPSERKSKVNLLDRETDNAGYNTGSHIIAAEIPELRSLKVKISGNGWALNPSQENTGWELSEFDSEDKSREVTFTAIGRVDIEVLLLSGNVTIDVFENGSETSTWSRTIVVN